MFENDDEAKAWADAWVQRHVPSQLVLDIKDLEVEHFKRFNSEYGRWVAQFEVQYSALVSALDAINYVGRSAWPAHRSVQYALLAYNVKSLFSASDRICRGYYEDGITLTRGAYEAFIRVLFVSCYPDDAYSTLIARPPPGVPRFNLANFLKDHIGVEWDTKYSVFSPFAHSNSLRTIQALKRAIELEGEPELFGFQIAFDEKLAEASLPLLNFVLLTHLRFVLERLVADSAAVDRALVETLSESIGLLTYQLESHHSEYWRVVAADLDVLFAMLEVADERGDWKAFLKQRPGGRV